MSSFYEMYFRLKMMHFLKTLHSIVSAVLMAISCFLHFRLGPVKFAISARRILACTTPNARPQQTPSIATVVKAVTRVPCAIDRSFLLPAWK